MTVAAVYLTMTAGSQADRLVGAATPRAAMAQIHVVSETAGMARMRATAGVDVPATRRWRSPARHAHHADGPAHPLVAGERVPLTLQFERAGKVGVEVEVSAPDAAPPAAH
jgi:copper(I)-binding protein